MTDRILFAIAVLLVLAVPVLLVAEAAHGIAIPLITAGVALAAISELDARRRGGGGARGV
jgi:hypothetical protein